MKRSHQWYLTIGFLAVIYVVPLTQTAVDATRGQVPQAFDVFRRVPSGEVLRGFEKELEDQSVFASSTRPWIQWLRFKIFRDAGEKILFGKDGWLFYRPDVRYLVEPSTTPSPERSEDPIRAITDFRDQLRARHIELMVVPMPGKPSLYGSMLTGNSSGSSDVPTPTLALIARLRQAGVETFDLFEVFKTLEGRSQQPYYLARDTHWSPHAAEVAAAAVATRLVSLGWAHPGTTEYGIRKLVVRRQSDIARMSRVPAIEASFPPEEVLSEQVFDKATNQIYRDDPASPVLVLGDSFLRIYQSDEPRAAGFIAHLARRMRRPVASLVNDGGASTLVRQELARRPQLLSRKKVVIWEFVERDIRFGTEGWKLVALPSESGVATTAPYRSP